MKGKEHPIFETLEKIMEYFLIEKKYDLKIPSSEIKSLAQSFDSAGISVENPVRDKGRSFYINEDRILLGHLTGIREELIDSNQKPFSVVAPGRVYRVVKENATHSIVSHQIEGIIAQEDVSISYFIKEMQTLYRYLFNENSRYTPDFTVFTSPTVQFYLPCWVCNGVGCACCYHRGELTWCAGGLFIDKNSHKYISFCVSLDRLAMKRHGLKDCRNMYYKGQV